MTTTHSVNLSEHEVRAALRGELELIVRPVKPQPHWENITISHGELYFPEISACPLGVPGDELCCKETWCQHWRPDTGYLQEALYRADGITFDNPEDGSPWKAATTMPRWASRITLEVVGVRCCLLHQLCEDDFRMALGEPMGSPASHELYTEILALFKTMWGHRYGKRYPWESNPWVWSVSVKRVAA